MSLQSGRWDLRRSSETRLGRLSSHLALVRRTREETVPQWTIPLVYAVTAVALGAIFPRIEAHWLSTFVAPVSIGSAVAIDSSIASGMMALTGIVFSLVFVVVQFGATAYSPRLVSFIARDPLLMHAIGMFTATFVYAVAALLWIDRNNSGRVPFLSVSLVILLLLASVAILVGLVQRLTSLQIQRILIFAANRGRAVIDTLYPPLVAVAVPELAPTELDRRSITQTMVDHGHPRAIQGVDAMALLTAACESGGVIEMVCAVGDTVGEGIMLLRVYGASQPIDERVLRKAILVGEKRTFQQDPKYALHILSDIAIRALSPAINDPSTAVQALDQVEDLLLRLGRRRLDIGNICDAKGTLRLIIPVPAWEDFLSLGLDQIRHYGAGDLQVVRRMRALLNDLQEALPPQRRPALRVHMQRLESVINRSFEDEEELVVASAEDRQGLGAPRSRRSHM